MPTQTGSIDLASQKAAHDAAAQVATNYVTDLTNGAFVHPEGDTSNGVQITDSVEIIRDGETVAEYGDTVQIGGDDVPHLEMDSRNLKFYSFDGTPYFHVADTRNESGAVRVMQEWPLVESSGQTVYYMMHNATDTNYTVTGAYDIDSQTGELAPVPVTKYVSHFELDHYPGVWGGANRITVYYYTTEITNTATFTFGSRNPEASVGRSSISMGIDNDATDTLSVAIGEGVRSWTENGVVIGKYGYCFDGESFAVANGTDYEHTGRAFVIRESGDAAINGSFIVGDDGTDSSTYYTRIRNASSNGTTVLENHSGGEPTSRLYFSQGGGLSRSMYSNDSWSAAEYYARVNSFVTDTFSASTGSISAGSTKWVTVNCAKSGYTLLGPVGYYFNGTGSSVTVAYALRKSSNTECHAALKNNGTAAANFTLEIQCLYVRNN